MPKRLSRGKMLRFILATVLSFSCLRSAWAGDDASGPVPYRVDLSQHFTTYSITTYDKVWSASLAARYVYKGPVLHFVRTSLPLMVSGKTMEGAVYQAVEKPDVFYIVRGDTMLKLGSRWAYNPGVGGFSMYAQKSRDFIVCFNFVSGGVPLLSSSPVKRGIVTWNGNDDWDRLK